MELLTAVLKTINPLLNADVLHALAAMGHGDYLDSHETDPFPLVPVERFAFYDKASTAYAVIASGERRFYGCFILTKGVIAPGA